MDHGVLGHGIEERQWHGDNRREREDDVEGETKQVRLVHLLGDIIGVLEGAEEGRLAVLQWWRSRRNLVCGSRGAALGGHASLEVGHGGR